MDNRFYILKNVKTGEVVVWTLDEVLVDINRDRSEQWQDYDVTDWKEGLEEFTEWELVHEESCEDCTCRATCKIRGDLVTWCKAYAIE